jgi:hypothetical protein
MAEGSAPAGEVLDRRERAGRLGSALAGLARDLADARREIALLRRENAALRARLACVDASGCADEEHVGVEVRLHGVTNGER